MHTHLTTFWQKRPEAREAADIIGRCVHCGFCTATCPTYQLLGDELDSPRGRIYLIKQVLEGKDITAKTQQHLDRCLSCRNCETTCPSGVEYGRLVDIGKHLVDEHVPRPKVQRWLRYVLKEGLTSRWFPVAMRLGQWFRPLVPSSLKNKIPECQPFGAWPKKTRQRQVILLEGCVQPAMLPNINTATARVLDAVGVQILRPAKAGCCGAIRHHLNDHEGGLDDMRRNIDAWWPLLEQGAEAIVMNASGCGLMVKDYGHQLRHDPLYAERAARVSAMTQDLAEFLPSLETELRQHIRPVEKKHVIFHPPCTLQHGQKLRGRVESFLGSLGFIVSTPDDSHMCCGSAGTYSVLQPKLAYALRDKKLAAIEASGLGAQHVIASANIGCITHLQSGTTTPVRHWIELIDAALI